MAAVVAAATIVGRSCATLYILVDENCDSRACSPVVSDPRSSQATQLGSWVSELNDTVIPE